MNGQIDRRHFLKATSTLLALGAMGARTAFAQSNNLRLIFWGSKTRADVTNTAAELFSKKEGGSVQSEFLSWNDYWPKLATQTAGGNAPDVLQMDYRYIVEYATRQAIAPLDEFIGNALNLGDFDKDQLEGGSLGGKLYGISLGANSSAMIINTNAFQEAGIEIPTNALTYDDLRAIGEAFKRANIRGGIKAIADASGLEPFLENWLRQRGKALYTPDGKLAFEADDIVQWFKLWAELREAGICVTAEDQALDLGPLESTMLVMGKAALLPSNSNLLVALQAMVKDKLTMCGFPRVMKDAGGGHYRKPAMLFSVAGSSNQKEAAAKFISFFVNNPDAAKILGTERGIPCSAAAREAIAPTLNENSRIALDFVANLGDLLGPIPPPPPKAAGEIELSVLKTLSQEVAFGTKTPEDAGPEFVGLANDLLNRG